MQNNEIDNQTPISAEISFSSRPLKVVFLILDTETEKTHWILDAIFYESYTRWGGAKSQIVTVDSNGCIASSWKPWLSNFDPDIIYAYVDLSDDLVGELNQLCLPISFIKHKEDDGNRWQAYIPDFSLLISPVSSLSTLTSPIALAESRFNSHQEQVYLTQSKDVPEHRFIPDNFGIAFHTSTVTYGKPGVFKTLCYAPIDLPKHMYVGDYVSTSLAEILSKLATSEVKSISKLAFLHSNRVPEPINRKLSDRFHLIIGESVLDRVNFWNVRHYSTNSPDALSAVIVSPSLLGESEFCESLINFLNQKNSFQYSGHQNQIYIKSYSLSEDACKAVLIRLQENKKNYSQFNFDDFFSSAIHPEETDERVYLNFNERFYSSYITHDLDVVITPKEPEHFQYIPTNFLYAKRGQSVCDLRVERHHDAGKYSNVKNYWKLPRRSEVVLGFTRNQGKVNKGGGLSLIPSLNSGHHLSSRPEDLKLSISLPDDPTIISLLVCGSRQKQYYDMRDAIARANFYENIKLSDKGQYHRGVVSKFNNVADAAEIFTNKYWRDHLRSKASFKAVTLKKMLSWFDSIDMNILSENMLNGFSDRKKLKSFLKANFLDVLQLLVEKKIVIQSHAWKCNYCGTKNQRSLQSLNLINHCDVCNSNYSTPIDFEMTYSFADYVLQTLVCHSGLTVLWAISHLLDKSISIGNFYLPEIDLYEKYDDPSTRSEIDLIAVIDGLFHIAEVKYAVTDFKKTDLESLIGKVTRLCPDVVILAFEIFKHPNEETAVADIREQFDAVLIELKSKLPTWIKVRAIIAESNDQYNLIENNLGPWGDRTENLIFK